MSLIIIVAALWIVFKTISSASAEKRERERKAEIERIKREQAVQREEARRAREEAKAEAKRVAALAMEQERLAKEQERQAAQLAKHEEHIAKLEQKMSLLEDEMRFNEHQRGSVSKLLNIAEDERDCLIKGSKEWQRAHKKVIALENQYHTYDKRLKKAMSDYKLCAMQKSA